MIMIMMMMMIVIVIIIINYLNKNPYPEDTGAVFTILPLFLPGTQTTPGSGVVTEGGRELEAILGLPPFLDPL